ncbi:Retrovirus-related Pol polyprotein from transposon TNT 1-94 [Araneus ventricosus]|uniref:Retrovirus-related Pol polyprotein from transposon TNT 1-94 n=1 Tax=Araneus ventricosus TaxID=182803 RepID=A0A4Y2IZ67_ARAVE|nr:Retrovirus-related Pol polyprotein from transposon TNT 1-94 [Araneus ventricosus]
MRRSCYKFKNEGSEKEKEESLKPGQAFTTVAEKRPDYWLIDSGAWHHVSSKFNWFSSCKMFGAPQAFRLGDGRCMCSKGIGDIQFEMLVKGKWNPGSLTNVWHEPESRQNLFSSGAALDKGLIEFAYSKQGEFRNKNGDTVGIRYNGVYKLLMRVLVPESACAAVKNDLLRLWRERMGHQNKRYVQKFLKSKEIDVKLDSEFCDDCMHGKSTEEVCEEHATFIDAGEETETQDIDYLNTSLETEVYNLRNRSQLQKSRFDGFVMLAKGNKPFTFQGAIISSNRKEWRETIQEELNSLNENETWEMVNLPQGRKPTENIWVYKTKKNADGEIQCYKACTAAGEGLKLAQFDVKCAFLYVNEEIHIKQPQGYEDGTQRVCKLKKSLYGLKQVPRCWNQKFNCFLQTCNLEQTNSYPCLFVNKDKSIFPIFYVDDGIIAAKDEEKLQEFLKNLEDTFSVRIEPANYFLGLQILHLDDGSIFIHQENFCKKVLDSFSMSSANPVSVSFHKSLTCLDHSEKLQEDIPYRKAVGSLMYLAVVSRSDIAYSVAVCFLELSTNHEKYIGV